MKLRKNQLIIIISIIVIGINTIALSKYDYIVNGIANAKIAKAIVRIEKDDVISTKIEQSSFPMEYDFSVHNYDEEFVNEVDFDYVIEIENFDNNFPVSYVLMDCDNNKTIELSDGKSQPMKISKNVKQVRNFKLCFQWKELDCDLSAETKIHLKINVVQGKEGEKINEI